MNISKVLIIVLCSVQNKNNLGLYVEKERGGEERRGEKEKRRGLGLYTARRAAKTVGQCPLCPFPQ